MNVDTLKSMYVFKAIVELGSFTKAADSLNMSVSSTSKHLSHLEAHIRTKLLHRNNRKQSLTYVGEKYYRECCHALDILEMAKREAQQETIEPQGILKIVAPIWFASPFCTKLFADFNQRYPKIQLSLTLENHFTDLIAGGFDIALRVVNQPQENIIAKQLASIPFTYVATPSYLEKQGKPATIEDLQHHIGLHPSYVTLNIPLPVTHSSSNTVMLYEMAKAGMGVAALPEWLIIDAVESGELIQLFDLHQDTIPLFAAYMDRTFINTKIRVFLDFMSETLSDC